jgi:hypothetical protein
MEVDLGRLEFSNASPPWEGRRSSRPLDANTSCICSKVPSANIEILISNAHNILYIYTYTHQCINMKMDVFRHIFEYLYLCTHWQQSFDQWGFPAAWDRTRTLYTYIYRYIYIFTHVYVYIHRYAYLSMSIYRHMCKYIYAHKISVSLHSHPI